MLKNVYNYTTIKKLIPTYCSNTIMSDRREIGLQIADFQPQKQLQKQIQKQKQADSIKNVIWLG
jgi:hypothetical protein